MARSLHPVRWLHDMVGDGRSSRSSSCSASTRSTSSTAPPSASCCPRSATQFGLGLQGVLTLVGVVTLGALAAAGADRAAWPTGTAACASRCIGAAAWGVFSLLHRPGHRIVMLAIVRTGSGIGRATVDPTHNSLLADYYAPANRPRVYSFHRAANAVGAFVGPLARAACSPTAFGWRVPFIVFAIPTFVFVVLGLPAAGAGPRRAGAAGDGRRPRTSINTEEVAAVVRRGLAHGVEDRDACGASGTRCRSSPPRSSGSSSLAALDLRAGVRPRRAGPGLRRRRGRAVPARRADHRRPHRHPADGPRPRPRSCASWRVVACVVVGAARSSSRSRRTSAWPIVANAVITGGLAMLGPGHLRLAVARHPAAGPVDRLLGGVAVDHPRPRRAADRRRHRRPYGIRWGMLADGRRSSSSAASSSPSAGKRRSNADINQVWTAAAARSEVLYERRQGTVEAAARPRPRRRLRRRAGAVRRRLRGRRGRDRRAARHQRRRQVDAAEGDLRRGRGRRRRGHLRRARHRPTRRRTRSPRCGVVQVPGGQGVFPSLTVAENLRVAGWLAPQGPRRGARAASTQVLELFPVLARAPRRARGQPVRRPAADARARHGVPRRSRGC